LNFYSEVVDNTRKFDPKHFAETMMKGNATFKRFSNLEIG